MTSEDTSAEKTSRPVGRPPRARTNAQKIEELKLGKFADSEPLCLPEREVKRGWQIAGGVVLLVGAALGVWVLMMQAPFKHWFEPGMPVMSFWAEMAANETYVKIIIVGLMFAIVASMVAGVMMLMKKRVPLLIWGVLILAVTALLLGVSFRTFRGYEERLCYENYPGIYPEDSTRGSQCPSVMDGLVLVSLRNILIFEVGMGVLWLIVRMRRCHRGRAKIRKH